MKQFVFTLTLAAASYFSHAQSFYLKVGGGYSFPLASYPLGLNHSDIDLRVTDPETGVYRPTIKRTGQEVTGSFNSGITSSLSIGYLFPSNFGVEVSMGYMFGRDYSITDEQKDFLDGEVLNESTHKISWRSRQAFIAPSFVITTSERKLKPYASAGIVLAIPTVEETEERMSDYQFDYGTKRSRQKYSRGLAVGMRGAAGLDFKFNETLGVFSEIAFTGMSYYPSERETVEYEINGEDQLSSLSPAMRNTKFVKRTDYDSSNPQSQPSGTLRQSFGMSGIAAQAGVKLLLK